MSEDNTPVMLTEKDVRRMVREIRAVVELGASGKNANPKDTLRSVSNAFNLLEDFLVKQTVIVESQLKIAALVTKRVDGQ